MKPIQPILLILIVIIAIVCFSRLRRKTWDRLIVIFFSLTGVILIAAPELGNAGGGLPYTLIYDRSANLREKIIGGLDKARLERLILPLI